MASNTFFSSGSASTLSPTLLSPNVTNLNISQRFQQPDYIKRNLTEEQYQIHEQNEPIDGNGDSQSDDDNEKKNGFKNRCLDWTHKHLIVYKMFYFMFYGAVGSLFPYLAVFYKQLFLSAQQVGFLIGVRPFIQMATAPLWGAIADTCNVKKIILLMSIASWLGTNYSISLVRIPPSIACAQNDTMVRLPPPAKITDQSLSNLTQTYVEAATKRRKTNITKTQYMVYPHSSDNRPGTDSKINQYTKTHKIDTFLQDDKLEPDSKIKQNMKGRKIDRVLEKTQHFIVQPHSRQRRSDHLVTGINTQLSTDGNKTINQPLRTTSQKISEAQRLLAADEIEEEFDTLNTDGDYPWPLESDESVEQKEVSKNNAHNIFIVLIIITVLGTTLASPTATLADTATLENLNDQMYNYGFQRVWGALGWGLGAFIVGLVVSYIQRIDCRKGNHVDYILSFYVYAVMMGLAFICALFFKFSLVEQDQPYSQSLGEAIYLFCDCQHVSFVITLLCSGASLGFVHTFLFWHLHDLGATQTLFSMLTAVQCLSEVIMYFVSGYLLLKIGYDYVLYIGLTSNILRLIAYSCIREPLLSLPIEILQGVSSAAIWTSAVCYIGLIPGAPVTLQALLHAIYWGLGHGGGGILGGVLVTYIGSNITFTIYAILSSVNLVYLLLLKYRSKLMELLGNYTYVENIPAGTYILTSMSQRATSDESNR